MATTRLDLNSEVLRRLGDTAESIWTAAEVNILEQEGYDLLCLLTGILWTRQYLDDVAGTATAALPAELLEIERATWDDIRLVPCRNLDLRSIDSRYEITQGDVEYYAMEGDGLRIFRKYRIPSGSAVYIALGVTGTRGSPHSLHDISEFVTATRGFPRGIPGDVPVGTRGIARGPFTVSPTRNTRIEYIRRGATLSADDTLFEIPDWATKYVRFYCLWRALEHEGDGQDVKLAEHYKGRFEEGVNRIGRRVAKALSARVGIIGGTGQQPVRHKHGVLPWNFGTIVR